MKFLFRLLLLGGFVSGVNAGDVEPQQAKEDAFPEAGRTFYLAGELIQIDHVNRTGVLRPDRSDLHNKYFWDLPHHFVILPYGSVYYQGASAALGDLPVGTHLHGWFYLGPKGEFEVPLSETNYEAVVNNKPNRFSPDSQFNRVLRLEDDFTFYQYRGVFWKVETIDLKANKLALNRVQSGTQKGKVPDSIGYSLENGLSGTEVFDLTPGTRVWSGNGISELEAMVPGDEILLNFTWATLYGPGRVLEIWRDKESREAASERQRRGNLVHLKNRGVPGMIESVEHLDKGRGMVTVTLYAGPDPAVLNLFQENSSGMVVATDETLRSYDQMNDFKIGSFRKITREENPPPGSSGIRIAMEIGELLEGYRPGRTVRVFAHEWERIDLPREERLWLLDVRPRTQKTPEMEL